MRTDQLLRIPPLDVVGAEHAFDRVLLDQKRGLDVGRAAIDNAAFDERCEFAVSLNVAESQEVAFACGHFGGLLFRRRRG
jgi:hypothetical protein